MPTLYDWLTWSLYLNQILHIIYCCIEHITCTSSGCHNIPQAQFNSVQSLSHVWLTATPWTDCCTPGFPVHHQLPELTQTHIQSQWCHPTISSVIPFSTCPQSLPTSGSFQKSQFFTSGGQSIGVSSSASVLPMNIQDWFPLGLTGLISLQSMGLSRVFSNPTVQKSQLFST